MANTKKTQLQLTLTLLLVVLLMGFYAVQATNIQVCGDKLADALALACGGNFASYPNRKRASLDIFDYVEQQGEPNAADSLDSDWRLQPNNHGSIIASRRLMRGVVDECCLRPCTWRKMRQYCAN